MRYVVILNVMNKTKCYWQLMEHLTDFWKCDTDSYGVLKTYKTQFKTEKYEVFRIIVWSTPWLSNLMKYFVLRFLQWDSVSLQCKYEFSLSYQEKKNASQINKTKIEKQNKPPKWNKQNIQNGGYQQIIKEVDRSWLLCWDWLGLRWQVVGRLVAGCQLVWGE